MNDVVLFNGVPTPYKVPELITTVTFMKNTMFLIFDLDYENIKLKQNQKIKNPHSIDNDIDYEYIFHPEDQYY